MRDLPALHIALSRTAGAGKKRGEEGREEKRLEGTRMVRRTQRQITTGEGAPTVLTSRALGPGFRKKKLVRGEVPKWGGMAHVG
jgi:hypothetical protein